MLVGRRIVVAEFLYALGAENLPQGGRLHGGDSPGSAGDELSMGG